MTDNTHPLRTTDTPALAAPVSASDPGTLVPPVPGTDLEPKGSSRPLGEEETRSLPTCTPRRAEGGEGEGAAFVYASIVRDTWPSIHLHGGLTHHLGTSDLHAVLEAATQALATMREIGGPRCLHPFPYANEIRQTTATDKTHAWSVSISGYSMPGREVRVYRGFSPRWDSGWLPYADLPRFIAEVAALIAANPDPAGIRVASLPLHSGATRDAMGRPETRAQENTRVRGGGTVSPSPMNRAAATTRFGVKPWTPHRPAYQRA